MTSSDKSSSSLATKVKNDAAVHQHGIDGVWYGGNWLDIEECDGKFNGIEKFDSCSTCDHVEMCSRSRSRTFAAKNGSNYDNQIYDILIIGAGCIGAAIARELSKYQMNNGNKLSILWVDSADDVSQGATKGNSGIVHAGYDDTPGTNRAKYCWKGNQMFASLDKELRFGYQTNGSLVLAMNNKELEELYNLKKRGEINGVQNLRVITNKDEILTMEPYINPNVIAALYSPDAGNVIPYEYTIALAENACDNGVELRIRTAVIDIQQNNNDNNNNDNNFTVKCQQWEPSDYIKAIQKEKKSSSIVIVLILIAICVFCHYIAIRSGIIQSSIESKFHIMIIIGLYLVSKITDRIFPNGSSNTKISKNTSLEVLTSNAGEPLGKINDKKTPVTVTDMLTGGSGSPDINIGAKTIDYTIQVRNIINCAGGAADIISKMINDNSFKIKPRVGDYLLLKKKMGYLAKHTIFPCPDPILGKGVLVQTTLWGNLILGPTARDMHNPEHSNMTPEEIQTYILTKCKQLVPSFDPTMTIHAFAGARAKSDRGDWIIEPSKMNPHFIHVAGIDSPGLAGSPAIALEVVNMLQKDGLLLQSNPNFKKDRAPIITPKPSNMKGLKMGPIGKYDSDGSNMVQMAANVICKCEKVTELEVVRAMRRSLPIDSSQGIRKRTRAGMGSCQAKYDNYNCEARVRAIIARENQCPITHIGKRPWPATSTLKTRWPTEDDLQEIGNRMSDSNDFVPL